MPTILIVEDNYMIADMVEDTLVANGYGVCGIANTVDGGAALYRQHRPDLLIIDLRLAEGELGTQLIPKIRPPEKVGILYVTGNGSEFQLSRDDGHACLSKPYRSSDLLQALKIVTDLARTGIATPPFPAGFLLLEPQAPMKKIMA